MSRLTEEEYQGEKCAACGWPSDGQRHKGKSYCHDCYEERVAREVLW